MSILEIILLCGCAVMGAVITLLGIRVARRPQTQVTRAPASADVAKADEELRKSQYALIEGFSQRLASSEGQITAMKALLEGVGVLRQRLDALESHMPAVQEAYEKYADQIGRADKRDTERQRRTEKTEMKTAGEAAADLALAGGVEGSQTSATAPPAQNSQTSMPGVLGGGGRSRG